MLAAFISVASAQSPSVTAFGQGSNTVSVASDVFFDFDQEIFAGSGTITLNGGVGDVRTFDVTDASQVTIRGNRLTINPTSDLDPLKNYSVQVSAGAVLNSASTSYGGVSDTSTFSFSTGRVIYTTPLRGNNSSVGSGTQANPYESIGYATTRATNAGDTVYVLDPGITVARSYTLAAVGTAAAPVVLKPAPTFTNSYQFSGLNNFIVGASTNLVIEGFTFNGGSDQTGVYEIASNVGNGFWQQKTPAAVALGGIAINVANGNGITIRDNVFEDLQQKAVNIENGRYVNITGNIIHDVATTSLSGGHGIMRQQGSGDFGTDDEAGRFRWDISGNLIFNVEQRLYSWVPSKGYLNMTLDEGKPINIDETTDTNLTARISDNIIAYAAIDSVRIKPTPNLILSNNSIYSTGSHADGITDNNTLGGSNKFPGLVAQDNLIMTAPGTLGLELGDSFPTTNSAIGSVSGNILLGGTASPTGLPGATQAAGTNLFVAPEAGDFTPAAGIPAGVGVHATVLADLNRKASNAGIVVAPAGWEVDHLKLTQTLLDSMPGLEDGIANNESVFTAPGSYANSVREPGRMSFFYSLDSVWKSANNVADGNLVNGPYEIITPEEYSA
ncbi:MAG: Ig-like domain-containing protein, partial [Chthoniobacterales bacterium]